MLWATRIVLFLTILFSLTSIYAGFRKKKEREELKSNLNTTQGELQTRKNENSKLSKEVEAEKTALKEAEQKLVAANAESESVRKELDTQQSQVGEIKSKLDKVSAEFSTAQTELKKITDLLPKDMPLEQVGAKLKEFADQMAALDAEKKVLTEGLLQKEARIKELDDKLKKKTSGTMTPGLTGHILAVNADWNFVVLDIGANQGVVENAAMIIYRDGNLIGKIKITSVEPSIAIGDIIPEWKKGEAQEGDSVVY